MTDKRKKVVKINHRGGIFEKYLPDDYDYLTTDSADFLLCAVGGVDFMMHSNCVKILYYKENVVPDFNYYDYAIGFHEISFAGRHLHIPYYNEFLSMKPRSRPDSSRNPAARKFCNFVYNNASRGRGAVLRGEFCKKLTKYKRVDCPGKVLHNMNGAINGRSASDWERGKIEFLRDYKFSIAFENSSQIGYTTEKLFHPFMADSIPIYWGNPDVVKDFNPRAFINCNDFGNNFDEVIKRIIEIDNDDALYMSMLMENPLNSYHHEDYDMKIKNFLSEIFSKGNAPFCKDEMKFSLVPAAAEAYGNGFGINFAICLFKYLGYSALSILFPKKFSHKADVFKKKIILAKFLGRAFPHRLL